MEQKRKVTLITGASRGIGRATALVLASAGARLGLGGRDSEALTQTARLVTAAGGEPLCLSLDVTQEESIKSAVEEARERWGTIDHLVNNAGTTRDGLLLRTRTADWASVLETNLTGTFRVTRQVLPGMIRARSGRIVNIASVIGEMGNPGQTSYGASKAGIIGFSKSLAQEVASRSITVNCVAPGYIETEMTAGLTDKSRQELLARIPLGRSGTPEDVAHCIEFLLSEGAAYITGAVLKVNGGLYM